MSIQESSRRVYRYRLPLQVVSVETDWPVGSVPISVALRGDEFDVWADVPYPDLRKVSKRFFVVGTGQSVPRCDVFLGTLVQFAEDAPDGRWVWHVFHDPDEGV
jgi:hypothetical protein